MRFHVTGIIGLLWAGGALAGVPVLFWPLDCVLGQSCFIQQFVDHDPGPKAQDFACGSASYDGHKGTDIRVPTEAEMRAGVAVLASAGGRIAGLRDGMADHRLQTPADRAAIAGRECGNGVVVVHGDGWRTQYCHMKKGSIRVKKGQQVARGAVLGLVGLSGDTQFPHVHLGVYKGKQIIDPFQSQRINGCGGDLGETLWDSSVLAGFSYQPSQVVEAGFANQPVTYQAVQEGKFADQSGLAADKPLVIFGLGINLKKGDEFRVILVGPRGEIVRNNPASLKKNKAQWMSFAGRKAPSGGWPKGGYTGRAQIVHSGRVVTESIQKYVME